MKLTSNVWKRKFRFGIFVDEVVVNELISSSEESGGDFYIKVSVWPGIKTLKQMGYYN